MPKFSVTDDQRDKAVRYYLDGRKTEDIVTELGIARSTLYQIIKTAGLRPSRLGADLPDAVDQLQAEVERLSAELERERKEKQRLLAIIDRLTK